MDSKALLSVTLILTMALGYGAGVFRNSAEPRPSAFQEKPEDKTPMQANGGGTSSAEELKPESIFTPGLLAILPNDIRGWYPKRFTERLATLGLTDEELAQKDLGDLGSTAMHRATGFMPSCGNQAMRELSFHLPRHWRAVSTAWHMSTILNSGLSGFFSNSDRVWDAWLVDDLEFLGATEYRKILEDALDRYYSTNSEFMAKDDPWKDLTTKYYSLKPDLGEVVGGFVKKHPELFRKPAPKK